MPEARPLSLMADGFKLLSGFLPGLLAALSVRIWQSRIDEHAQRYDDVRNAILRAAEISTDYWLRAGEMSDRRAEANLVGLFQLLNGLAVELATASRGDPRTPAGRLVRFNHLTTGGPHYEVDCRPVDVSRAMAVQREAADLILYGQDYRRQRLTMSHSLGVGFFRGRGKTR